MAPLLSPGYIIHVQLEVAAISEARTASEAGNPVDKSMRAGVWARCGGQWFRGRIHQALRRITFPAQTAPSGAGAPLGDNVPALPTSQS